MSASSASLHPLIAGALVFFVSGAVLVLEILAGRMLAPYVGLSLETYTAIIGVVLAGISTGTWIGGRLADALNPRRLLGPVIILGGLLSLATVPVVRELGGVAEGRAWYALGFVAALGFFLPTAVLSAANPLIVKLQLQSLSKTGQVVGRLSALGTAGAIAGTFLTGFVLLPSFRTSRVVLVLGVGLVAAGWVLTAMRGRGGRALSTSVLGVALLAVVVTKGDERCEIETAYFCANVKTDLAVDPSRRVLELDNLVHSYVDLEDPTVLGLGYTQRFADVVDAIRPPARTIDALHIGGGGFTMPRYIAARRPSSRNLILELDPGLVRLARDRLGLRTGPRMRVRTGDARVTIRDLGDSSYDLVLGDAFAGVAVPWHLTTREALEDVRRTLRSRGAYAMNIIDHPPLDFLRAETRTLMSVFRHVALMAQPSVRGGVLGSSNYVLLGSDATIPIRRLEARMAVRRSNDAIVVGRRLRRFSGDGPLLTDDYAPADQLLTR